MFRPIIVYALLVADRLMGNADESKVDLSLLLRGMVTVDFQIAKIGLTEQKANDAGYEAEALRTLDSYNAQAQILGRAGGQ